MSMIWSHSAPPRRIGAFSLKIRFLLLLLLCVPCGAEEPKPLHVLAVETEPFLYLDPQGRPSGLENDLLESFCDLGGCKPKIVWVKNVAEMLDRLEKGEGDLAAGAVTITSTRKERFDFSRPFFPTLSVVIERSADASQNRDDLKMKKIVVGKGTIHDQTLRRIGGFNIEYLPGMSARFKAVASGKADATMTDSGIFAWLAQRYPTLAPSLIMSEREFYGFVLRKQDPRVEELDVYLEKAQRDGEYRRYLEAAFGEWGVEILGELLEDLSGTSDH